MMNKSIMMIVMILLLLSYSLVTTTCAQTTGAGAGTILVQMKPMNYRPYALIFLKGNSSTSNSTFINITELVMDDSDICYNEFEMINDMLYSTYTSALLVESTISTETLETLDSQLVDSQLFTSVAAVVDGSSDQNVIIVHQDSLPLPPPDVMTPSLSPSNRPSLKPISLLRPPTTPQPTKIPTMLPTEARNIDDGIIVTTTNDGDTFSVVGDECATLIMEVIVPTSAPVPQPIPVPVSIPQPVPNPVPVPVTSQPNTFTGTFTLVKAGMGYSSSFDSAFIGNYSSGATINISSFGNQLGLIVNYRCCFHKISMNYTSSTAKFVDFEAHPPYALEGNSGNNFADVPDLRRSGIKRIVVFGYDSSNRVIATTVLNFNIVGGLTSRRVLSSPIPAPVPSTLVNQCNRRRLLEDDADVVLNHDDNGVHNSEYTDLVGTNDDESLSTLQTKSNEQRRLQTMCRLAICDRAQYIIDIYGCRRYCIYHDGDRRLLRREQSHEERKTQSTSNITNIELYRQGKISAITRGRGDVTAAVFYKYVKQYIPNEHVCQPILLSMTYIIMDLDIL